MNAESPSSGYAVLVMDGHIATSAPSKHVKSLLFFGSGGHEISCSRRSHGRQKDGAKGWECYFEPRRLRNASYSVFAAR